MDVRVMAIHVTEACLKSEWPLLKDEKAVSLLL